MNIKPGKPTLFGVIDKQGVAKDTQNETGLFFGLPGNPVSAILAAQIFITPSLLQILGQEPQPKIMQAILETALPCEGKRAHYRRAMIREQNHQLFAKSLPEQDSAQLKNFSQSNGLIICPANSAAKPQGAVVDIFTYPHPLTQF